MLCSQCQRHIKKTQLTVLGVNQYAGLFVLGAQRAGFTVAGTLESGNFGSYTFRLNFPEAECRINGEWGRVEDFAGVDLVVCAPPCAPWSNLSSKSKKGDTRERYKTDDRVGWMERGSQVSRQIIKPQAYAWESIIQIWDRAQPLIQAQRDRWMEAGYAVSIVLHDTSWLGAPQRRVRFMFIAHQHELKWPPFVIPRTLHQILEGVEPGAKRWLDEDKKFLWEHAYAGQGYLRRAITKLNLSYKGPLPGVMTRRLSWDQVPPVLIDDHNRIHPSEPRYFSMNEHKALAGVGQNWKTSQRITTSVKQVGEAVLPDVGEWIATAVKNGLRSKPLAPTAMIYDFRDVHHCHVMEYQ